MSERIVANGGQNSYAGYRENSVPDKNLESQPGREGGEKKAPHRFVEKPKDVRRDEPKAPEYKFNPGFKLEIGDAARIASVVRGVQEEQQTMVDSTRVQEYVTNLRRAGLDTERVKKMTVAEVVVASQQLLISAKPDFDKAPEKYLKDVSQTEGLDEKVMKRQIEVASNPSEEILTEDKVVNYLSVRAAEVDPEDEEVVDIPPKHEIVYETEIDMAGDVKFPAKVFKRVEDGQLVMTKLPTNKYTNEVVGEMLSHAGVDAKLPEDFEKLEPEKKLEELKKLGIDTIDSPLLLFGGGGAPPETGEEDEGESEPGLVGIPFNALLDQAVKDTIGGGPVQPQLIEEINSRVRSQDPRIIYESIRGLENYRSSIEDDPGLIGVLNTVLPQTPAPPPPGAAPEWRPEPSQQELFLAREDMDKKFTTILDPKAPAGREAIVGDIENGGKAALSALRYGYSLDRVIEQYIIDVVRRPSLRYVEPPGAEGLRSWYAEKVADRVRNTYEILQRSEISPDPYANIRSAEETMRFYERSESVEDFGLARQRLNGLLNAIEESTDASLRHEDKVAIREKIEAFKIVTPIFITYNHEEGDPEHVLGAAKALKDETMRHFYSRFDDVKDKNELPYMLDKNGNRIVDENDKPRINLLGEAENAMSYQLMVDRWRVNQVEELTRGDLNASSANLDEQWIMKDILGLPQKSPLPRLTGTQIDTLNSAWNDGKSKQIAIKNWYREYTFLGVDGFSKDPDHPNQPLREVQEQWVIDNTLKQRLLELGVGQNRVDALYENTELMQAMRSISANMTRFKGLVSALDRIRVYDKSGKLINSLYSEDNPYIAHEADHMPDYFLSDGHGDKRVNKALRDIVDTEWKTFFLASNQTIYRVLSNEEKSWTPQMKAVLQNEIDTEIARVGPLPDIDRKTEVEAYVMMSVLHRGINPNINNGRGETDQLDIFRMDQSKASERIDNYVINDNLSDRASGLKMMRGVFKKFTFQPYNSANFEQLMSEYYSSRHTRKRPGAELFLRTYWEVGQHWKKWFDAKSNISNAQMEMMADKAVQINVIDKKRVKNLEDELLGRNAIRQAKQLRDFIYQSLKDFGRPGSITGASWDLFFSIMKYMASGK